jgi:hypothetical protein
MERYQAEYLMGILVLIAGLAFWVAKYELHAIALVTICLGLVIIAIGFIHRG